MRQHPFLEGLVRQEALAYLDYALAEHLLKSLPTATEAVAAFLCYLSAAMREGHLCVRCEDLNLYPDPALLLDSEQNIVEKGMAEKFRALVLQGIVELPPTLITTTSSNTIPLYRSHNLYYFQRHWQCESTVLKNLQRLLETVPEHQIDLEQADRYLTDLPLLPEQKSAILNACQNSLTLISGGPGTGKTYTAGHLIRVLWDSMSALQRQMCSIAVAAPTGKAAANLQNSLRIATKALTGFPVIQAATLHSLLGIGRRSEPTLDLKHDIIVIDESSMIDATLMMRLLAAIKPGARLILLGDPHQLPPVGSGMLFADFISLFEGKEQAILLKQCLRTELQEIVDLASAVKSGDHLACNHLLSTSTAIEGTLLNHAQNPYMVQQQLLSHALPRFESLDRTAPEQLLESLSKFCILSPLRKGPLGVNALNDLFGQRFSKQRYVPIMIKSNDAKLELFNGDLGILVRSTQQEQASYALFPCRKEGAHEMRKIPSLLLPAYEYAYCLSVHKSQGSEFDHVLLLMPEGSQLFGRELLYTGVTRARKSLDLWYHETTLCETLQRHTRRLSSISSNSS